MFVDHELVHGAEVGNEQFAIALLDAGMLASHFLVAERNVASFIAADDHGIRIYGDPHSF
jgi:hypothetical protein